MKVNAKNMEWTRAPKQYTIQFGIYACSAEDSSFKASFTNMEVTECKWLPHDGQAPDEE